MLRNSPGLNNREWIETASGCCLQLKVMHSPGLNNREWIETSAVVTLFMRLIADSPGLNNREWIETRHWLCPSPSQSRILPV